MFFFILRRYRMCETNKNRLTFRIKLQIVRLSSLMVSIPEYFGKKVYLKDHQHIDCEDVISSTVGSYQGARPHYCL